MDERVKTIFATGLGDFNLRSIAWEQQDLVVRLAIEREPRAEHLFRFMEVRKLAIDLDFGQYVGEGLLWDASLRENESGVWMVEFEFGAAPDGAITFECDNAAVDG